MKLARPMTQVAFSLPPEVLERVDALRARERRARPGLLLSRGDVLRELVLDALDRREGRARDTPPAEGAP